MLNVPAIENVTIKYASNVKYFKVIYSPLEYMEFTYNMTSKAIKVLSYTVDNFNLIDLITIVGATDKKA